MEENSLEKYTEDDMREDAEIWESTEQMETEFEGGETEIWNSLRIEDNTGKDYNVKLTAFFGKSSFFQTKEGIF